MLPAGANVIEVVHIGVDVHIDPTVEFGLPGKSIQQLWIGDHVTLHGPSRFAPRCLVIGDYTKIYDGAWCGGAGDAYFGHNVWIAPRCIMDPTGGIYIGNGFGAGHETHLWSHIRHGDVMVGCRYLSYGRFVAEDDVWFVGRATGMPVWCEPFSVALTSATVTRDMLKNRVYAGTPAVDITQKVGRPYVDRTKPEREAIFHAKLEEFSRQRGVMLAELADLVNGRFDVMTRTYPKTNEPLEVALMRFLLPEIKFVPVGQEHIPGVITWPSR